MVLYTLATSQAKALHYQWKRLVFPSTYIIYTPPTMRSSKEREVDLFDLYSFIMFKVANLERCFVLLVP